jgi:phosphatidylserine/phosphatidylglycerophosphate/cardiolipin synthase-like enzyme
VILDKINQRDRYTGATYLVNRGIEPPIDDTVAIAHNKVIIIDAREVITGSFNFSRAALHRNAENVLVVHGDPELAKAYADNWRKRAAVSHPYRDFRTADSSGRSSPAASASPWPWLPGVTREEIKDRDAEASSWHSEFDAVIPGRPLMCDA